MIDAVAHNTANTTSHVSCAVREPEGLMGGINEPPKHAKFVAAGRHRRRAAPWVRSHSRNPGGADSSAREHRPGRQECSLPLSLRKLPLHQWYGQENEGFAPVSDDLI